MRYVLAILALVVFTLGAVHYEHARATQNAVSAYNACAVSHNFAQVGSGTGMVSLNSTFGAAYSGGDFERDVAALYEDINVPMGTHHVPGDGEDMFNATLESELLYWPDA